MTHSNTPIKLGVVLNAWHKLFGVYAQSTLREKHVDSTIIYYSDENALFKALLAGEIQAVPKPLKDLPTTLPEGAVITAIKERETTRTCLLMPKKTGEDLALSELKNAKIAVQTPIIGAQIEALLPENQAIIQNYSPLEVLDKTREGVFDACILTSLTIKALALDESSWHIFSFSPREFITEAGQGISCLITAEDDLATRRLVKPFHSPLVTPISNVERQVKKLFNDTDVAAYCERDASNNFHLWAAVLREGRFRKVRLSQTTSIGLAERAAQELNAN
jgi:porphobilinogen deaminase